MPATIWQPLWLSAWVSGAATLIGLLAGSGLGYVLARKRFAGRDMLDALVLLPQVVPPLVAAGTIAFARAVGDFGVTLMIAGNIPGRTQTASIAIYDLMQAGRDREALGLSIIVSAACIIVVWLSARAGRMYHHAG